MNFFSLKKFFVLGAFALAIAPCVAFAQNPAITSYTISETSINSGQAVTFSWGLSDAGGYSFVVPCSTGIKLKKADGSVMDCDIPISTSQVTNDAIVVIINNASGGVKNVTGRLIPKSTGGVDYAAGSQEKSVSVQPLAQPITSFTASKIDTVSGQSITIDWSSQIIDGVNLQIDCKSEIMVSSPSYTNAGFLPCGKIVFASDLGTSGSLTLSFTNSSISVVPYTVKLYPAIDSAEYFIRRHPCGDCYA